MAKKPFWADIVQSFHTVSASELHTRFPQYSAGWYITTTQCESRRYLPWLLSRFRARGGCVVRREVLSLSKLHFDYDVIVNCTGLGARQVVGDESMYPIRGQVARVRAPWVKQFVIDLTSEGVGGVGCHILPVYDTVVVGGIHADGDWNDKVDKQVSDSIIAGCCKLMPSLKDAPVVSHWAGLRPARPSIRLELDMLKINGKVIHNYGHGGSGVTLSWGCGTEVTELLGQAMKTLSAAKL